MFGIIVAGRPIVTEFQTIDATKVQFTLPATPAFSHLVVFMLPGNVLPEGSAAAVYAQLPSAQDFNFLGGIANDKQTAIFKINTSIGQSNAAFENNSMIDDSQPTIPNQTTPGANVVIGISLEPVANVEAHLANLKNNSSVQSSSQNSQLVLHQPRQTAVSTKVLAQRIIKNAFNFLASFAGGSGGNEVVPLKSFQDWWQKFEKRIELDPTFLERDQD